MMLYDEYCTGESERMPINGMSESGSSVEDGNGDDESDDEGDDTIVDMSYP